MRKVGELREAERRVADTSWWGGWRRESLVDMGYVTIRQEK